MSFLAATPQGLVGLVESLRDSALAPAIQGDFALLAGGRFTSYQVQPTYNVGSLPFWLWPEWLLRDRPLSMIGMLVLACAMLSVSAVLGPAPRRGRARAAARAAGMRGGVGPAAFLIGLSIPCGARAEATAPSMQVASVATPSPMAVLMDQARYWRQQGRVDLALSSLNRALLLDPQNTDALALAAELNAERGEHATAEAELAKLRAVRPDDPRIAGVTQALRVGPIDPAALAQARDLARQGHATAAVEKYRALFHGGAPPDAMAVEYNQVMAGTEGGWDAARAGLAQFVSRNPQDARGQLAYAELLTYRPATRADGIGRLAILANNPATADAARTAWRQALDWVPVDPASMPLYQAYLAVHPDDAGLAKRLADGAKPEAHARGSGGPGPRARLRCVAGQPAGRRRGGVPGGAGDQCAGRRCAGRPGPGPPAAGQGRRGARPVGTRHRCRTGQGRAMAVGAERRPTIATETGLRQGAGAQRAVRPGRRAAAHGDRQGRRDRPGRRQCWRTCRRAAATSAGRRRATAPCWRASRTMRGR